MRLLTLEPSITEQYVTIGCDLTTEGHWKDQAVDYLCTKKKI